MLMHWAGLRNLVTLRGGLHSVTVSLAYVVHVDRMCAVMLNKMPTYIGPSVRILQLPRPSWSRYGSRLLQMQHERGCPFSFGVLELCSTMSSLLELWELSHGTPIPKARNSFLGSYTSLEYLYYTRDRIDEQFAVIHANLYDQNSMDKCILCAARIVEYSVTWSNYIPPQTTHVCEELCHALQTQDLANQWAGSFDVLAWTLFSLSTAPSNFKGRPWVISHLKSMIGSRYATDVWPTDWQTAELDNLKSFVWCSSACARRFDEVCSELDPNLNEIREIKAEPDAEELRTDHLRIADAISEVEG